LRVRSSIAAVTPASLPTFRIAATVKAVIELTNSGHVGGAELVAAFVRLR
jgi:hypothetical protein